MLVPHMGASSGSASRGENWPTPVANDDNKSSEAHLAIKVRMKGGARTQPTSLQVVSQMWPTPHGFQAGNGPDGNEFSTAVRQWATPRASDGVKGSPNQCGGSGDQTLSGQAANFATPTARIWRGGMAMTRKDGQIRLDMPDWQSESFSPPVHPIQHGRESSPNDQTSRRRLNPQFVEWLMGWPAGWTSIEPTACDAAAMASWRCKLRSRLSSLLGEQKYSIEMSEKMSEILIRDAIYRVIDTETTGREPSDARICELAWVDISACGVILDQFQSLVNPGIPIPPSASAIHHIVDEDVAEAPSIEEFADLLAAEVYVAHNAEYDSRVLGLSEDLWICTHRLAKHLWAEIANHSNQEVRYTLKLKPAVNKHAPAHRAMNDALVTASILSAALPLALEKWPGIRTVEELAQKIKEPVLLHVVPFKSANGTLFKDADSGLLQWIIDRGAGGEDCVHSAMHWLEARGYSANELFEDDERI